MREQKKKSQARKGAWWLILIIALGIFLFSAYQLITIFLEYKKGSDEYKDLRQYTEVSSPEASEAEKDAPGDEDVGPVIDFAELKAINEDIVGWLVVEAVDISYPIVQGKDNDYYLHRTFKDTYNFAGSIFLDYKNKADFSDCNSIVYGHNMKDASMFGKLKRFREKETYEKSMYFWICTPEKNYKYQIFSAQEVSTEGDTYTLFSAPGVEFKEYLEEMRKRSEIPVPDTTFTEEDKAVMLSTCTGNDSTRFVVQGKRIESKGK